MGLHLTESLHDFYSVAGIIVSIVVLAKLSCRQSNLDAFPTAGSSSWLGSLWDGMRFLTNARNVIRSGYKKHYPLPFKVAEFLHWTVIISDPRHLQELSQATNDQFTFLDAVNDKIQIQHTLGRELVRNPYHVAVLRSRFTPNIAAVYPEIRDEITSSFDEILGLCGNDWKSVHVTEAVGKVICRATGRVFVGFPLCRDPDWIDLNIRHTAEVVIGGVIVGLFPEFMRPLAARFLTSNHGCVARGLRHLNPIIEERRKYVNENREEWNEKPKDLLYWLMEEAEGSEMDTRRLATSLLTVSFAAIHTSCGVFVQALFHLAKNPKYVQSLREEIERIVKVDGWSKTAVDKMRKVDSVLKESVRYEGIQLTTLWRKSLTDFTFSDGTFIPKGTNIAAATQCLQQDEKFYVNPEVYEPFRFADLQDDLKKPKYQFISGMPEYLPFGLGRHTCPGRFFASTELKTMLAHVAMTYDVKLVDDITYQPIMRLGPLIPANPFAKLMFRKREL